MAESYTGTESFYGGGASSLSPDYGNFIGYQMSANQMGFPGSPQNANQLGETVNALKQGVKAFEVSLLMPDVAEAVPKEHFKEMRALMKLSGVKPSVHGPILDSAGFSEKGWGGNLERADNERRMFDAIEKAHVLDPNGNVPIVFHGSAGAPGSELVSGKDKKRFEVERAYAINRETKQMSPLEREYKFRPGSPEFLKKGGELYTSEAQLGTINETDWENKMTELATFEKHADEVIGAAGVSLREDYQNAIVLDNKVIDGRTRKELPEFSDQQRSDYNRMRDADIFLENVELNFTSAFHKAYKYGTDKQKEELEELSRNYKKNRNVLREESTLKNGKLIEVPRVFGPIGKKEFLRDAINDMKKITSHRTIESNGKLVYDKRYGAPKVFEEVETFAMGKSAKTFGNLAMKSYDKFGGNAPVIAIENFMPGTAFSSAEKLKELVETSRENFAEQLIKDKGLNKSEAKEIAEKHLGVTWDVGHLNMIKKKGFTDKDVLAETKKITEDKTMVKHLHLTDNFGFADSHLAPGMGNVPFKKIMEQLEKTGRIGEMRKIVEAGGFVQHFKKSPHGLSMAAFGSPIYGMKAGPSWNQVAEMQGSYFGGYGTLNPQQHHSMYGSGFTTMPIDLGGQMPGDQSRFGGAPMA